MFGEDTEEDILANFSGSSDADIRFAKIAVTFNLSRIHPIK